MVDGLEEIVDEKINGITSLLNEIYLDDLTAYCNSRLPGLYAHEEATFKSIFYSLLDDYERYKERRLKLVIGHAMKSCDTKYDPLKEFIAKCIIEALNNDSLTNVICKVIYGNCEELYSVLSDISKDVIKCTCDRYFRKLDHGESDRVYKILDEYDKNHENRYPVD